MLDLRRIRETPDEVRRLLAIKGVDAPIDRILELDQERRRLLFQIEQDKAERNRTSTAIAERKRQGQAAEELVEAMRALGDRIAAQESALRPIEAELEELLLTTPNTPWPDVPPGRGAEDNVEVYRYGEPKASGAQAIPHWELGERLQMLDFERAHKLSGARFTVLTGWGAKLSRALINFMLDHATARGYQEMEPPVLVLREAMVGTGQFPKFVEDVFRVVPHEYYLIPTAEVPLTNYHREEILDEDTLPRKYVAYTPCFRSEAGAAGRDTRGLIRQHQFDKVELVQLVRPEDSAAALEAMRRDAELVLERLELPFRTVLLCGGDMGFGQAKTYDLEVWMPSYGRYVEISSVSNMSDFQARRASIRYRPRGAKRTDWVHTLNGSALAVGRTLAAILENYQTESGGLRIPEALVPYLGGMSTIDPTVSTGLSG
ncbi:MAG: serine--tRNA ligase [Firmicutes bacterium]|nr:serine--tRNA ligase [Alicyclobacillaceae bacterium]MCL6496112.1 serine--tRNA ligase [Bacillota bacterium]